MLKLIFISIILIHALIHFMGFAKAFNYTNIPQLTSEISKPIGILWLLKGFLFLLCVGLYLAKKDAWIIIALVSVILSQTLIINSWNDAKFGTIPNLMILMLAIIGTFQLKFKAEFGREVNINMKENDKFLNSNLTKTDIADLPLLVQKYILYTGSLNKPKVVNFRIEMSGKIRDHKKKEWMELTSEQYNFIKMPTRLFYLDATTKGLPLAGFHFYKYGTAYMDIRLLSIFNLMYQEGTEMDVSETVTFFNDICVMAPAALIDKRIEWLAEEENKVKASFTNNGIIIFAWLYFNIKGELINFISEDRYATNDDGSSEKRKWSTPLRDYRLINGYKLASYAETIYAYPEDDFTYATFNVENIQYNLTK